MRRRAACTGGALLYLRRTPTSLGSLGCVPRNVAPQVTTVLVDFLILPVWILWLAAQLRNLSAMGAYASSVEMAPALAVGAIKSAEAEADANVV